VTETAQTVTARPNRPDRNGSDRNGQTETARLNQSERKVAYPKEQSLKRKVSVENKFPSKIK